MNPSQSKAALITGAAKRIGAAMALSLAKEGYDIAITYHSSKVDAIKLSKEIQVLGQRCQLFACDLSKPSQTEKLITRVYQKVPALNVLINNASIFQPAHLKETSYENFLENINIHLTAPFILSRDFFKCVKQGNIINMLDTHVTDHLTMHSAYLLSKKSLQNLTQMCAIEFAPKIRVNAIAPGLILAPADQNDAYLKQRAKHIPLETNGQLHQITHAVHYLLTNEFVTGQTLFVDGGEHLQ